MMEFKLRDTNLKTLYNNMQRSENQQNHMHKILGTMETWICKALFIECNNIDMELKIVTYQILVF
jgi:hypothetical protein